MALPQLVRIGLLLGVGRCRGGGQVDVDHAVGAALGGEVHAVPIADRGKAHTFDFIGFQGWVVEVQAADTRQAEHVQVTLMFVSGAGLSGFGAGQTRLFNDSHRKLRRVCLLYTSDAADE